MTIQDRAAKVLQEIDAALALADKATPGPWIADNRSGCCATYPASRANDTNGCRPDHDRNIHYSSRGSFCEEGAPGGWTMDEQAQTDNTFIAASRTLLPTALLCLKTAIRTLLAIVDIEIDENGKSEPAGIAASATICAICDEWEARQ